MLKRLIKIHLCVSALSLCFTASLAFANGDTDARNHKAEKFLMANKEVIEAIVAMEGNSSVAELQHAIWRMSHAKGKKGKHENKHAGEDNDFGLLSGISGTSTFIGLFNNGQKSGGSGGGDLGSTGDAGSSGGGGVAGASGSGSRASGLTGDGGAAGGSSISGSSVGGNTGNSGGGEQVGAVPGIADKNLADTGMPPVNDFPPTSSTPDNNSPVLALGPELINDILDNKGPNLPFEQTLFPPTDVSSDEPAALTSNANDIPVEVRSVSEPSTVLLSLIGIAGLAVYTRRGNKRSYKTEWR